MTRLVSPAEYSRIRKVSKQAVSKALATGRITAIAGPGGKKLIDVDQAHADWAKNTDIPSALRGAPDQLAKSQSLAHGFRTGRESTSTRDPAALNLLDEKTRSERLKIRRQEIELEQLEGLSVSREAVVAALSSKLMSAGETLQGIPDRLAAVFASETDAAVIHRVLSAEIRAAMSAIATVPDALH